MRTILLLGGTSEIAVAVGAELLSRAPARVVLAARASSPHRASAVAALSAAGATEVVELDFDAADTATHPGVIDRAFAGGQVDVAVVAFGVLGDVERAWRDQAAAVESVTTNFTGAVSVGVLLADRMRAQGRGRIIAIGSVAGIRVRRANFVYGAAKAGFDAFFVNLGEALRGSGVRVLVVRPGPVSTKLIDGLPRRPFTIDAARCGEEIVAAALANKTVVWTPPVYRAIMAAVSAVPQPLMRFLPF